LDVDPHSTAFRHRQPKIPILKFLELLVPGRTRALPDQARRVDVVRDPKTFQIERPCLKQTGRGMTLDAREDDPVVVRVDECRLRVLLELSQHLSHGRAGQNAIVVDKKKVWLR